MKQVSQNYKSGAITIEEVNEPLLQPGGVLVQTCFSVISAGTEGMKVREGKMSYLEKARARPDQVKKVVNTLKQIGPMETYRKVMNRLDSMTPLGYSSSGVIIDVGGECQEFSIGQRVACGGVGHAEMNFVPKNLVVPVPDNVPMEHAAFTTIGSIVMHAFRLSGMQLGETACVIGLGLLGQILVQILKASGMQVLGIDIVEERCVIARQSGASLAVQPDDPSLLFSIEHLTSGFGADCVFLCTGGVSNQPVELAVKIARDRAHVIDIGKTKLDLPWNEYYEKELDVSFSRSYGPGRYDKTYEIQGIDYPIGYVRWTERRNMAAFLELLAEKKIQLDNLVTAIIPFIEAPKVYRQITEGHAPNMGVVFEYSQPKRTPGILRKINFSKSSPSEGIVRLGVIGAGNFASSVLLPILKRNKDVQLLEICTTSGLTSANAARKFGFERTSSDHRSMLDAKDIDAVLIATRHASHASLASEFLRSGKVVFVEKPLAIDLEGLALVHEAMEQSGNQRLMVGFNRRFSPLLQEVKRFFSSSQNPLMMSYRVHAGRMEKNSWYQDPLEGSRFVGEAGHFLDVFSALTSSLPVSVFARNIRTRAGATLDDMDNLSVQVEYEDGSLGNLLYLTQGANKVPKEYMEVFGGGRAALLNNFGRLDLFEGDSQRKISSSMDKGHSNELNTFIQMIKIGAEMPISNVSIFNTTLLTLAAVECVRTAKPVQLREFSEKLAKDKTEINENAHQV
jgi:predicted dehydrogenase/threonine dehydrogenase-like Zn-dependent dehydrogenase